MEKMKLVEAVEMGCVALQARFHKEQKGGCCSCASVNERNANIALKSSMGQRFFNVQSLRSGFAELFSV